MENLLLLEELSQQVQFWKSKYAAAARQLRQLGYTDGNDDDDDMKFTTSCVIPQTNSKPAATRYQTDAP